MSCRLSGDPDELLDLLILSPLLFPFGAGEVLSDLALLSFLVLDPDLDRDLRSSSSDPEADLDLFAAFPAPPGLADLCDLDRDLDLE